MIILVRERGRQDMGGHQIICNSDSTLLVAFNNKEARQRLLSMIKVTVKSKERSHATESETAIRCSDETSLRFATTPTYASSLFHQVYFFDAYSRCLPPFYFAALLCSVGCVVNAIYSHLRILVQRSPREAAVSIISDGRLAKRFRR